MSGTVRWSFKSGEFDADSDEEEDDEETSYGVLAAAGAETASGRKKSNKKTKKKKWKRRRVSGDGHENGVQKAKRVFLAPFRKLRRLFSQNPSSSFSTSYHRVPSSYHHRQGSDSLPIQRTSRRRRFGNVYCCYCFSQPQTLENGDNNINTLDVEDPTSSNEYLKSVIEKNDFYSEECNTHVGQ